MQLPSNIDHLSLDLLSITRGRGSVHLKNDVRKRHQFTICLTHRHFVVGSRFRSVASGRSHDTQAFPHETETVKEDDMVEAVDRWTTLVRELGIRTENALDFVRKRFRDRLTHRKPMKIVAFHGMGNDKLCRLRGRLLEYRQEPASDADSIWQNLQDSYRRFETDEVPNVVVCVEVSGKQYQTITDDEGYFEFEFPCPTNRGTDRIVVMLTLPDYPERHEPTPGTVFFPAAQAAFGVISDIDDTILVTQATSIIRMMRLTLLESSSSRKPFGGVAAFYAALHAGANPFFYVSSSPWNLFEFLDDFICLNSITRGPLLLRDYGIDKTKLIAGPHKTHKLRQIKSVLEFYPDLTFILIGDSGQQDPEIYAQIVNDFPGRILSVYIRDVGHAARDRQVQSLSRQLEAQSVDMLLVPDTLAAANHASRKQYVEATTPATVASALKIEMSTGHSYDGKHVH